MNIYRTYIEYVSYSSFLLFLQNLKQISTVLLYHLFIILQEFLKNMNLFLHNHNINISDKIINNLLISSKIQSTLY